MICQVNDVGRVVSSIMRSSHSSDTGNTYSSIRHSRRCRVGGLSPAYFGSLGETFFNELQPNWFTSLMKAAQGFVGITKRFGIGRFALG